MIHIFRRIAQGYDIWPREESIKISHGVIIQSRDIATTHEEADNIIVLQAMQVAIIEQENVTILADDMDVYAFLLHHYL